MRSFLVFSTSRCDPGPNSRGGLGPRTILGPVVFPGSNFGSGSVSGANEPTEILASEKQRDPAFALAVSSLERCLLVRERVGSSLNGGRSCKPTGSGGLECRGGSAGNAGLFESDLEGVVGGASPRSDVPGAVVSRAGGVNGADPGCTSPCADVPRGCGSDLLREDGIEGVRPAFGVFVFTLEEPRLRMRLQVRVGESLTCLSLVFPRIVLEPPQPQRAPL